MKTLLLILFFGKTTLLTLHPVDINTEWIEIIPKKPLTAITSGAALDVDVTPMTGYVSITGGLEKIIPKHTVTAELIPESGAPIVITNRGSGHGKDNVFLILGPEKGGMPIDIKFKKIRIRSATPLKQVKVRWRNYSL